MTIADQAKAIIAATPDETAEQRAARYERGLRGIARSTLTGADFGDWVQATCEELLDGGEAECPLCSTPIHEGACVSDNPEEE